MNYEKINGIADAINELEEVELQGLRTALEVRRVTYPLTRVKDIEKLEELVIAWSKERNIIDGSTRLKQQEKLAEETTEIRDALVSVNALGDMAGCYAYEGEVLDGIGDSIVCLINLAKMSNSSLLECLSLAWEEIKDRKGAMINGSFVKEADLPTGFNL